MDNQDERINDINNEIYISEINVNYTENGTFSSYEVTMSLDLLNEYKVVKKKNIEELESLVKKTLHSWEKKYRKYIEKKHQEQQTQKAKKLTSEAKEVIDGLKNILNHALEFKDVLDFESIKLRDKFSIEPSKLFKGNFLPDYLLFNDKGKPIKINYISIPDKPTFNSIKSEFGLLRNIFYPKSIVEEVKNRTSQWEFEKKTIQEKNKELKMVFESSFVRYMELKRDFEEKQNLFNKKIDILKINYFKKSHTAIEEYCNLILKSSNYQSFMPKSWRLQYKPESKILVIEYDLPSPGDIPSIESYSYDKANDKIKEIPLSSKNITKLYDDILYEISLRTIHEIYVSDLINAIDSIGFNGVVTSINKSTGNYETRLILSILVEKEKFESLDLKHVAPKRSVKHLKGISASSLMELTPIVPQIQIDRHDHRFVEAKEVIDGLDESINLATMHWEDFEHLVREVFEKEFLSNGGEVRITQASSDGGVDAIAFDPDPIRGGKIIIQAKRYTNIVGVSAVRDLYGTVLNEGATKGILVTTSDYGKDSYTFAQNKPLTLINGNNLLAILEKQGHFARINLAEAKKINNDG